MGKEILNHIYFFVNDGDSPKIGKRGQATFLGKKVACPLFQVACPLFFIPLEI